MTLIRGTPEEAHATPSQDILETDQRQALQLLYETARLTEWVYQPDICARHDDKLWST